MKHSSPFDEIPANLNKTKRCYLRGDLGEAEAFFADAYVAGRPWMRDDLRAFDVAWKKMTQEWARQKNSRLKSP